MKAKTHKIIKIILIMAICVLVVIAGFLIYSCVEAEKMFYKYSSDGDKWVCEKYNITLTCHLQENDTPVPDYYLETNIKEIEKTITISDFRGGHSKTWIWKDDERNIPVLIGDYHIKNKNTLEFSINNEETKYLKTYASFDDSLSSMFKPDETLVFNKVE